MTYSGINEIYERLIKETGYLVYEIKEIDQELFYWPCSWELRSLLKFSTVISKLAKIYPRSKQLAEEHILITSKRHRITNII